MPDVMRCVLFCMLEAVEGELFLLEDLKVMCCVLLSMLGAVQYELSFEVSKLWKLVVTVRHSRTISEADVFALWWYPGCQLVQQES